MTFLAALAVSAALAGRVWIALILGAVAWLG